MLIKLKHGDCLEVLKSAPDNYADSLVTDPPAGISFMGKSWDDDKGGRDAWVAWMTAVMKESLRVLKPGGHGLVWALPRTSHWTMAALEDAGFEVRDVVTHLFGTGFPKSLDVSKAIDKAAGAERQVVRKSTAGAGNKGRMNAQDAGGGAGGIAWDATFDITAPATPDALRWQGFGTALKPACEFWVLVRKPLGEKTVAANVLKHGTGGLNIDGCRIGTTDRLSFGSRQIGDGNKYNPIAPERMTPGEQNAQGRFPSHLVLDEEAAAALDEQSGNLGSGGNKSDCTKSEIHGWKGSENVRVKDSGGASRFFYVAKASKSDKGADNTHPTVKSTALMRYLIKLVTPPGGLVLDPFMGSGSTGVAAIAEGFGFVGIEQSEEYFEIASGRLKQDGAA